VAATDLADSADAAAAKPRRERILDVATEEFAAHGWSGTRIDTIATRAECNRQLIYYYFGSKAGLYGAVFDAMVEQRRADWERERGLDGEASLANLVQTIDPRHPVNASVRNQRWRRMLAWEGIEYDGQPGEIQARDARIANWRIRTETIRRAQSEGLLDPELDPELLALLLLTVTLSKEALPQLVQLVTGMDATSPEYADRLAAFNGQLLRALRPGRH
jgi:AcrR family transcriptional regulator